MSTEMSNVERPPARPLFRRLAAVLAVLCFLLAILFGAFLDEGAWFFIGLTVFVGSVMTAVATPGFWPPKR